MNIVVASSRGVGLSERLPKNTSVSITEGGRLSSLLATAKTLLPPPYGLTRRYHVYFLCGVPNITRLVKVRSERYRECVYDEDPSVTAERYQAELRDCQKEILSRGALPIFCTITKVNLHNYNIFCLDKNRTSHLKLMDKYPEMQKNLNQAITLINNFIYNLNKNSGISTPFLHHTIQDRRGRRGHKYYVQKWEYLYDGLHADETLHPLWATCLKQAMEKNALLEDSDSEDESSSRPWLPSSSSVRPGVE